MNSSEDQTGSPEKKGRNKNYSLCRASCSVCPYHRGLLKLLDHGVAIVPTLPAADAEEQSE
jgi:hypothetical protein